MNDNSVIPITWRGTRSIVEVLSSRWLGLRAHALEQTGKPTEIGLKALDGKGVTIWSKMHDLAPRTEVGVLNMQEVGALPADGHWFALPQSFGLEGLELFKLTIDESGFTAESGIALRSRPGDELIIVAADYPYTLAFFVNGRQGDDLRPEYPLNAYRRVRLE